MAERKKDDSGKRKKKRDPELQKIYDQRRAEFTEADLEEYKKIDVGVPLKDVIAEMEAIQREYENKRKKK